MDFKRRSVLAILFGGAAALLSPIEATAQTPIIPFRADEKLMMEFMQGKNVHQFLLLNKQRGEILLIAGGQITQKISALSGRKKGDDTNVPMTTPAGIFPLNITNDQSHPQAALVFFERHNGTVDVIHRVVNVTGEKRGERLQSAAAAFKRVSHGCINVSPQDYITVSDFANNSPSILMTPTGEKTPPHSYLVVLPENTTTRKFFNIPTPP